MTLWRFVDRPGQARAVPGVSRRSAGYRQTMPTTDLQPHGESLQPHGEAVVDDASPDDASPPAAGPSRDRRRVDWKLAIASFPIAVGVALIAFGLATSITGDEATDLPDAIESISPVPDAVQVLAQTNVVVDLAEGFEGELTVDGTTYETQRLEEFQNIDVEPGAQIDVPPGVIYEPGNDTLTFTPGPGIDIERFDEGNHLVRVVYWPTELGRQAARSYTWSFHVV
jgi:hypothetical protein